MMGKRAHHVDGCDQSKIKGIVGRAVRAISPKPGCVDAWPKVTCLNCLAKARRLGLINETEFAALVELDGPALPTPKVTDQ